MTTKELVPYSEFTEQMESLREKADFLPDMSTKEGYEASKRIHLDLRKVENAIDTERKSQKKYWLEGGKAVDKEGKGIAYKVADLREPHTGAYQKVDLEKKEREAKRIAALEFKLAYIRNLPTIIDMASSDEIKLAMEEMQAEKCEGFCEFTAAALEARNSTRTSLGELYVSRLQQEKDAADLAEFKRKQAEKDIADKVREAVAKEISKSAAKACNEPDPVPMSKVNPVKTSNMDEYREHQKSFNQKAVNELMLNTLITRSLAIEVVRAIARNQISNITINY